MTSYILIFPKFASLVAIYCFLRMGFINFYIGQKVSKRICVKNYNIHATVSTSLEDRNPVYVCTSLSLTIGPIALNLEIVHLKRCLGIEIYIYGI